MHIGYTKYSCLLLKTKLFGGRRDRRMGARFALDFAEKSDEY